MGNVYSITLCDRGLRHVPDYIYKRHKYAAKLLLRCNNIQEIPPEIKVLTNLIELSLRDNLLTSVPAEETSLTEAISIQLLYQPMTSVAGSNAGKYIHQRAKTTDKDSEITHLRLLQKLSLADNRLQEPPEPVSMFSQLTWLSLANNTLTTLPDSFSKLQKLTCLDLQRNRFSVIPDCVYQMGALTVLLLQKNRITTISPKIGQCSQLVSLNLSYNRIQHLPVEMKECRNLEHLILNVNSIQGLPADLCKAWTRLLNLDLHTNDLKGLPDQLGCMKSLRRLNLAINEIEDIPDSIGQLHLLEWLNLNDNKLVTLPTTMDQMRKLVKMGVVQNRLKILPAAIARLNLLYKLDVRRNEIEYLPSAFKEMQRIHSLLLEENPLSVKYGVVNYERQPPSLLELASRAVLENYCPQDEESVPFSSCAQTSSSMGSIDTAAENLVPMMSNLGMSKPLPPLPSPHQIPITQKSRHSFFSRGSSTIHPQQIKSTRSETLAPTCSSDSSSTASSSSPTTISPLSAHGNMVSPTATPPPGQSAEKQKSSPCSIRPSLFCRSSQNQQSKTHAVGHIQQPSTSTTSILAGKVSPSSTAATRRMNLVPKIDCLLDPEVSILPITLIDHLSIPTTACDYCSRRMFTSGWIDFLEPAKLGSARMIIPVRHRMCSMQCVRQQHRDTFGTELSELFESTDFHIGSNEEMIGSRPIIPEELDEYMIEAVQEAAQAAGISVAHLLEQYQQSQQAQSQQQQQQDQQEGAEDGTILPSVPQEAMPGSPPTNVFGNTLNAQQTMSSGPTSVNRQTAARLCRSISRPMPPIEIQVDPQGQLRRVVYRENKNNTGPRGRIFGPFSTLSQVNGQGEIGTLAATGLGGNTTNNSNTNNGNAGSTGGSRAPGEVMNVTTFAVELERY
ncbi:hypothetical protein BGZ79_002328 [Entomortierella chlamydospora]|nr:hypothetical protein BGZ79_002328 [Entomortierella chlamydospora]